MNKKDRAKVQEALDLVEQAQSVLDGMADAEREKFDNMSEGLQASEKGQSIDTAASALESIDFQSIIDSLEEALNA